MMTVKMIRNTLCPDLLAGEAAALCYNGKDPWKSLDVAMEGHHESVLEHATFTFLVEGVSRCLLAQLTRHRLASFSVQSQRYVSMVDGMDYVMPPKIIDLGDDAINEYVAQMETMHRWYKEWVYKLGGGRDALEDARFVLPGACGTKLIMTMNARELRHFFSLRCCSRAQWEIRYLANEMLMLCKIKAPTLFEDAGPGCVRGACPEGNKSCGKGAKRDDGTGEGQA